MKTFMSTLLISIFLCFTIQQGFAQKSPKADPSLEQTLKWIESNMGKYSFKYYKKVYDKKFEFDHSDLSTVTYTCIKGDDKVVCKFNLKDINEEDIKLTVDGKQVYLEIPCVDNSSIKQTNYVNNASTSDQAEVSKLTLIWIGWEATKNITELRKLEKALKHAVTLCKSGIEIEPNSDEVTWLE